MSRYVSSHTRAVLKGTVFAGHPDCYLCGDAIDYSLPRGLPGSPEMDDIIPVSMGGNPVDANNLMAVHKICNQRRGNLPADVAQRNAMARRKTSRVW